ncbi:MAG: hypothetical protein ABI353_17485 [Isosphaeraceae bacterium]
MGLIHPGRIVWAVAPSGRGEGKRRPFIIATRRTDIQRSEPIITIGCSTRFVEPLLPKEIRIPFDPEGKGLTGLRTECVAVCDWLEQFPPRTEFETGGMVPAQLLKLIFKAAGITYTAER